jgi:hypothetical protein
VIYELAENSNSLPLLAIIDEVDLFLKIKEMPVFALLLNTGISLNELSSFDKIKSQCDEDGKTTLHYAVQADDAVIVYWLLTKGSANVADKFGNTPIMDAVRLGHRRSFLLCLHYQHASENLAHIAAEYNRVWELKALLALGFQIDVKNDKHRTPLEVAVMNYSYEAAEYLAMVTHNYDIPSLASLTDSAAIIRRVERGYKNGSFVWRTLLPLLQKFGILLFLLISVASSEMFIDTQSSQLMLLAIYTSLFLGIFVTQVLLSSKPK